jgi:O-antigen ligase
MSGYRLTQGHITDWVGLRVEIWRSALELSKDQWLFGYGLGSFPSVLTKLGIPPDSVLFSFNEVHNQYLDFLLETGVLGLTPLIALLGIAFAAGVKMAARQETRERGLALLWVIGCYAIFGLSESFLSRAVTSLQFGVYAGLLMWTVSTRLESQTPFSTGGARSRHI